MAQVNHKSIPNITKITAVQAATPAETPVFTTMYVLTLSST